MCHVRKLESCHIKSVFTVSSLQNDKQSSLRTCCEGREIITKHLRGYWIDWFIVIFWTDFSCFQPELRVCILFFCVGSPRHAAGDRERQGHHGQSHPHPEGSSRFQGQVGLKNLITVFQIQENWNAQPDKVFFLLIFLLTSCHQIELPEDEEVGCVDPEDVERVSV